MYSISLTPTSTPSSIKTRGRARSSTVKTKSVTSLPAYSESATSLPLPPLHIHPIDLDQSEDEPSTSSSHPCLAGKEAEPTETALSSRPHSPSSDTSSTTTFTFEDPEARLDRLLAKSSAALATAQALLGATLHVRGSLVSGIGEGGKEGDDALERVETESRLRSRRDVETHLLLSPLLRSLSCLASDLEQPIPPHPLSRQPPPQRAQIGRARASFGVISVASSSSAAGVGGEAMPLSRRRISAGQGAGPPLSTMFELPPSVPSLPKDGSAAPSTKSAACDLLSSIHSNASPSSIHTPTFSSLPPSSNPNHVDSPPSTPRADPSVLRRPTSSSSLGSSPLFTPSTSSSRAKPSTTQALPPSSFRPVSSVSLSTSAITPSSSSPNTNPHSLSVSIASDTLQPTAPMILSTSPSTSSKTSSPKVLSGLPPTSTSSASPFFPPPSPRSSAPPDPDCNRSSSYTTHSTISSSPGYPSLPSPIFHPCSSSSYVSNSSPSSQAHESSPPSRTHSQIGTPVLPPQSIALSRLKGLSTGSSSPRKGTSAGGGERKSGWGAWLLVGSASGSGLAARSSNT